MLPRIPETEVMESELEAVEYDSMDHTAVNQLFVNDLLTVLKSSTLAKTCARPLHVLDVGSGTLQIPVRLLQTWPDCGPVWACDLSASMLRVGMQNVIQSGLQACIIPLYCDARHLPVPDAGMDVIISNSIIHHIVEPLEVLLETRRCIRPDGLIFIRDLLRPESDRRLDQLVEQWAGGESRYARQMFRDSLHAALTLDEMRALLAAADMDPHSLQQTSDRHWTVSWTAPPEAGQGSGVSQFH